MPDIKLFITDHSADRPDTGDASVLRNLYRQSRGDGISFFRYDWRWNVIEPIRGCTDHYALMRYAAALTLMQESELELPLLILSSIPPWALELYKSDKQAFFAAYESYARKVVEALEVRCPGVKLGGVQVLNELNNRVYTPVAAEDVIELCRRTRIVFNLHNSDLLLVGSLVVGNLARFIGREVREYMRDYRHVLQQFDLISLDYYPGVWHLPFVEAYRGKKSVFGCLGLLQEVMEQLAMMGKPYELDEVGLPTNVPFIGRHRNEVRQRYFFAVFFRALKHVLLDMERRGLTLPKAVGIYEALDEPPRTLVAKLVYRLSGRLFPEHDFGLRYADGHPKLIVRGNRRTDTGPSQLNRLGSYLNAPMV